MSDISPSLKKNSPQKRGLFAERTNQKDRQVRANNRNWRDCEGLLVDLGKGVKMLSCVIQSKLVALYL